MSKLLLYPFICTPSFSAYFHLSVGNITTKSIKDIFSIVPPVFAIEVGISAWMMRSSFCPTVAEAIGPNTIPTTKPPTTSVFLRTVVGQAVVVLVVSAEPHTFGVIHAITCNRRKHYILTYSVMYCKFEWGTICSEMNFLLFNKIYNKLKNSLTTAVNCKIMWNVCTLLSSLPRAK